MAKSKDLFDDSTMSFGEHLEILRIHLWKAIIGLAIGVVLALCFGNHIVAVIRQPIEEALQKFNQPVEETEEFSLKDFWNSIIGKTGEKNPKDAKKLDEPAAELDPDTIVIHFDAVKLRELLDIDDAGNRSKKAKVELQISSAVFRWLKDEIEKIKVRQAQPVTLTVQEAFMTYLKVSLVAGLVLTSPWVIFQMWQFVAAGLYPHERKYVYIYLPMSSILFLSGAAFCFYMVFPFVLKFLLGFNRWLEIYPQIRMSEWISFAIMLPVMFGLSFQLPLVMLFMERISIFEAKDYREKRRMAILTIAVVSMMMTPADPMSMVMMMVPLLVLYELGIVLCQLTAGPKSPFDEDAEKSG